MAQIFMYLLKEMEDDSHSIETTFYHPFFRILHLFQIVCIIENLRINNPCNSLNRIFPQLLRAFRYKQVADS